LCAKLFHRGLAVTRITRRDALLSGLSSVAALCSPQSTRSQTGKARMDHSGETQAGLSPLTDTKTKVFDPMDGFGAITNIRNFTDPTIFRRGNQWWMIGSGFDIRERTILLLSASLPAGTALDAKGWTITTVPGDPTSALTLIPPSPPESRDGVGGMHCPSYVRGWDPTANGGAGDWRERIYYAGSTVSFAGPYSIGYLEWDGSGWSRHAGSPVLTATESWEMPTVAEPNVIYHDGRWRMWYLAGPDSAKQFLQGYAESPDGKTQWKKQIYSPGAENVFDNNTIAANGRFESIFARYPLASRKLGPEDGLWWRWANGPYSEPKRWSKPTQLLSPFDGQSAWHAGGIWKPSFRYADTDPTKAFVFFDASYAGSGPVPIFTLGCIECRLIS
jgi:hypothetical protein